MGPFFALLHIHHSKNIKKKRCWDEADWCSLLTIASEYLLSTLLFSSPRTTPTLPTTALPKPTAFLVTLIVCLVLHPIALLAGVAWRKTREREGRIRLEEEVEEAEQAQLEAEEAERAERIRR